MKHFSSTAKFLHWSVAGLIVSQYVLAKLAENAKYHDQVLEQLALLANHKSVGLTILALAAIRIAYRLKVPAPSLPSNALEWQRRVSKVSHVLLYSFLFALPISGWLMSSAKSYSVSWFNLIALPDFVLPNESLAANLHMVHHYLAEALFVIALIHILAALKHHFVDKDEVLVRMSSKASWVLFIMVVILIVGFFGRLFDSRLASMPSTRADSPAISSSVELLAPSEVQQSSLPLWDIDYEQSYIKFTGDQAGAPFEGEWEKWSAEIYFDEVQLDQARFKVSIDPASGFSNDQERDDTIRSADFFDVVSFPNAAYYSADFSEKEGSFQSLGKLSMKGVAADVNLRFSVSNNGDSKILIGSASLDRFKWNIGSGDWADTTWVGQNVIVEVRVITKP